MRRHHRRDRRTPASFRRLIGFWALLALLLPASGQALEIDDAGDRFDVTSGTYRWSISKTAFTVIDQASADGTPKLAGGEASADFLGGTSTFGPPSEFLTGSDWIELRGWADQDKNLWYVARYRFFDGRPFVHLALALMDRHEGYETDGPWHEYWEDRRLSNYKVTLRTTGDLEGRYFRQTTSFTGREVGVDPDIIVKANEGSPFQWLRDMNVDDIELRHAVSEDPDRALGRTNSITWVPGYTGRARLVATLSPFDGANEYRTANDVAYEIQHVDGVERLLLDQNKKELDLGSYELDRDSAVSVFTESSTDGEGRVRARSLRVEPEGGAPFEITFRRLADDVLQDSGYALGVVDLWQHHPIEVFSSGRELSVNAITEPANWHGGIGLTLDLAIVIDAARSEEAMAAIKAPPARPTLPQWWSAFDGTLAPLASYDALLAKAWPSINESDQGDDNFGWRGYGDYQIGVSYAVEDGAYQDWGGLQYDLGTGLLLAWMRAGDERLWQRARAALRHQMDVSMVKFRPYMPKSSGHLYRKGACSLPNLITCEESIADFGYGYRGFLLWHHLTGEAWAKELAHQQIDALAYLSARSGGTRRSMTDWGLETGSRPMGWMLRALVTGSIVFPEGTAAFDDADEGIDFPKGTSYATLLEEQLDALLGHMERTTGYYPSDQPVWGGQGLEALEMAYLDLGGRYRSDALKRAILASCDDLAASIRWAGGGYEYVYARTPTEILEWIEEPNYGWLWLSAFAGCDRIDQAGSRHFTKLADDMFDYLTDYYGAQDEIPVREWASILAFGGYYLAR